VDVENRVALITGGRRIGIAVAAALGDRGMDVALAYHRSRDAAEVALRGIEAKGRRGVCIQADLSNGAESARLVEQTVGSLGGLDVLINMASVYSAVPFDNTDESIWNAVVDVDLRASFLCARAAVPHMRARGGGRIINFTDWIAASGRPRYQGYLPYYVAKKGVIGLTEALALELARDGILVNAIAPGPILAPEGTSAEEFSAVEAATPVGRWGGDTEIVRAVLFLLESGFTTGETIRVDGGRHVR
jgi:NAD(P)-dependent dehydrogenase (short-subunit alcohol dehydrogenase family)